MRTIALLLCAALLSGCATGGVRVQGRPAPAPVAHDPQLLADYVKELPVGSRVKAEAAGGRHIKGTLMKATDTAVVIQPRTRVPEPPIEVPLTQLISVELDPGNSTARTFGLALAAGAAGTLAVLLILFAAMGGD